MPKRPCLFSEDGLIPVYCYTNADGETIERAYGMMEDKPASIRVKRKTYTRDIAAEHSSQTGVAGIWPMPPCVASGVHPLQAQELRDHLKKAGVPTEVTAAGDPIYRDSHHRKRALAARGMHDRASY